jgi:hypothetical protein
MFRVINKPLVFNEKDLTLYKSFVLSDSFAMFLTDINCSVTLFVVGRWLYCVHKVQDYPNVGFSPAVAYHYKTNTMDTQTITEVRCLATNISREELQGFIMFSPAERTECQSVITFRPFISGG